MTKTSKVYVLVGDTNADWEPRIVLGVYASKELAEQAQRRCERRPHPEYTRFEYYSIEAFDLDEEPVMV